MWGRHTSAQTAAGVARGGRRQLAALAVAVGLMAAWLLWSTAVRAADAPPTHVTVAGSGSNLASARLLAEAFRKVRPDILVNIPASLGTKGGIRAAAEGAVALGLVSRELEGPETTLGLAFRTYARTAIVLGAHPTVADDGLTSRDVVEIYRGSKTRWRDGREIVVLTRQAGESSIEVMFREIKEFKAAYQESDRVKRWATFFTDQEMDRALTATPYALGLSDLGTVRTERLHIKILKVDGALPTVDDVRAGRYRLVKPLAFVYLPGRLPAAAQAFMAFALSKDGQRALLANGYIPADD